MNFDHLRVDHDITLADIDPDPDTDLTKEEGRARFAEITTELSELQTRLYAQGTHRVLVVFQAIDGGGKDGAIAHIFGPLNPNGVRVANFKRPSELELAHDYLWRVHQQVPGNGELVIFNRSHYEDVLVVRVHELVSKERWSRRYDHINNFETMLADEGTTIIKFFLHISPDEQAERFQARLDDPTKQWKFAAADLEERTRWHDYQAAFEDAINRTSRKHAPWFVIPANKKWYRDLAVATIMRNLLESLKLEYPQPENISNIVIPDV
jgi:PPK2 family polyphosphate:nucleotide phosphotransferase